MASSLGRGSPPKVRSVPGLEEEEEGEGEGEDAGEEPGSR